VAIGDTDVFYWHSIRKKIQASDLPLNKAKFMDLNVLSP
jgi:hypothetical protein